MVGGLLARAVGAPELRPYQVTAVAGIEAELAEHRSTLLVLATGLGKTVVFAEVVQRRAARGQRSLVLAHRTELLEQAAGKLEALGLDVGLEQADSRAGQHTVVVASVQTLQRQRLLRWAWNHFGLIVIDEAHHSAAKSYRSILDHFTGAQVLGVTATPDRGDGTALKAVFETVAHRYEVRDGIKDGWLAPLRARRVVVDGLDLSKVRTTAGDLNAGDLDLAMRAPEAVHGVVDPLLELAGERQTLVFAVTVEHAYALVEAITTKRGPGVARALDGNAPREVRAAVLQDFHAGRLQVLVNCALFTEGFDAPATSCVAVVRPTKSRALYTQMLGRGTRLAPGKTDTLVLDFTGLAGRHSLVGPADVLAGRDLEQDERAELELQLGIEPRELEEVLEEVQEKVRQRRIADAYRWSSIDIELFGDQLEQEYRAEWAGEQLTDTQRAFLEGKGVKIERLDRARAQVLIGALHERQQQGLCTYKQARLLSRHGVKTERLRFDDARALIDSLAAQGWKNPSRAWFAQAERLTAAGGV